MKHHVDDITALRARVALLEEVAAEAYQLAGAVGAPVRVLDNLDAAVAGRPLPFPTFLPIQAEECSEVGDLLRLLKKGEPASGSTRANWTKGGAKRKVARRNTLAAVLGRSGGQARTAIKAEAARTNGAKGGRPRKTA
jgi:hypothetical protein